MSMNFAAVQAEDFSKFGGPRASFQLIEDALVQIGGQGVRGTQFKVDALKAAGWHYGKLTTYASKAEKASEAFNKIRMALAQSADRDELLKLIAVQS